MAGRDVAPTSSTLVQRVSWPPEQKKVDIGIYDFISRPRLHRTTTALLLYDPRTAPLLPGTHLLLATHLHTI